MFFIGLFGIGADAKPAGRLHVGSCPVCKSGLPLAVTKKSQTFEAFFVPLFHFHTEYFATCPSCAALFAVPEEIGKQAERSGSCVMDPHALSLLHDPRGGRCPSCGALTDPSDSFCRHCGRPL